MLQPVTQAILQPIPYFNLPTQELVREMLQLQANLNWLLKEADKHARANQMHDWHDTLTEVYQIGQSIRQIERALNYKWRGYIVSKTDD